MELEQGKCPKCGKEGLDYGVLEAEDNSIYYPATCECGFMGKEYYNLHFVGYYDNDGNEILKAS